MMQSIMMDNTVLTRTETPNQWLQELSEYYHNLASDLPPLYRINRSLQQIQRVSLDDVEVSKYMRHYDMYGLGLVAMCCFWKILPRFQQVILHMMHPNPTLRASPQEAYEEWETVLRTLPRVT